MFRCFNEEKQRKTVIDALQVDEYWLIQSFIKILDSFLSLYWLDYINGNKSDFGDAAFNKQH